METVLRTPSYVDVHILNEILSETENVHDSRESVISKCCSIHGGGGVGQC
jgi:hypothetical protein